jgi:hypothetical protein
MFSLFSSNKFDYTNYFDFDAFMDTGCLNIEKSLTETSYVDIENNEFNY